MMMNAAGFGELAEQDLDLASFEEGQNLAELLHASSLTLRDVFEQELLVRLAIQPLPSGIDAALAERRMEPAGEHVRRFRPIGWFKESLLDEGRNESRDSFEHAEELRIPEFSVQGHPDVA